MSGLTVKLMTWAPQSIPGDEFELKAYRELCKQAVFSVWNQEHRPTNLKEIFNYVYHYVKEAIENNEWPYAKFVRSKRYVDRRVNEVASTLYSENGIVKIVSVTAGIYQPSPQLFELPKEKR